MSTSTHPIIIPSDYDVEDAFSSTHSPDYTPASPDYFLASPGNTPSDSLDDLTNNESLILPQAPIAPPTVLPPSSMLPPLLDPQDFFLPEEILPPQMRARFLSFSFDFSTPPQVFEIGESSHKTHLERHEEQIETILNHLD
ncbi:hypothetical protein Tco_0536664 [Tanacetum coccineum]